MILLILMSYTEGQGEHEVDLGITTSDPLMAVNLEIVFFLNSRIIFYDDKLYTAIWCKITSK